jgi:hypothetical protein
LKHNLIDASIDKNDNCFVTPVFLINKADEEVDLNFVIRFKSSLDVE